MEYLEILRENASRYSLTDLKKKVEGQEPIGSGMEGKVYNLGEDLVVKFRRGRGAGYNQFQDNLAEHQRQSIHNTINELGNGKLSWEITNRFTERRETLTSKLVDILACFVDGKESVSVMPYIGEETLRYDQSVIGMFEAYKSQGVTIDNHGENIMGNLNHNCGKNVDYIVIETWGSIHPDIFKTIERTNPQKRAKILEHLARAHMYGGTSAYPTPHEEMAGVSGMFAYHPITWHDVATVFKVNDNAEITYDNLETCLNNARNKLPKNEKRQLSECALSSYEWKVMGIPAIAEARQLFGAQFIPIKFDWDNGTNLDIYGISPEIYNEFRQEIDKVKPEIQPTIDEAKRLMQ